MGTGRPRKSSADKRTVDLGRVLVSPTEHTEITARAADAGMSIAGYLRAVALSAQVVNRQDWRRRTWLLANIANNLNQIGRWANTFRSAADAMQVAVALLRLERVVRAAEGFEDASEDQPA